MQTTLFKRAHTGAGLDNGYDPNSMAALSNLLKLNNQRGEARRSQEDCLQSAAELLAANSNLVSNLVSANSLVTGDTADLMPSALLAAGNHPANTMAAAAASLLESLKSASTVTASSKNNENDLILDKLALFNYQQQLLSLAQNSNAIDLARTVQLVSEISSSASVPYSQQSLLTAALPSTQSSANQTSTNSRPTKRQKTIPNPIQLTHSNFNNEQVQPLDLSIKSASSTASEHFILEPLNLSRSNSPAEDCTEQKNGKLLETKTPDNDLVQIQNALCKKKKMMMQRTAELLKKSSCSSAPCSPSSIATSSSPSDQPFDLDTSQSNQSNLADLCLSIGTHELNVVNHHLNLLNKKRKFSDSSFSLDSQTSLAQSHSNHQLPKLHGKRRQLNKPRRPSVAGEDLVNSVTGSNQQALYQSNQQNLENKPNTIIIDAKNTFTCAICGEMFAFKDRLSKHIKSKHRSKPDANQSAKSLSAVQQSANGRSSPSQKSYSCTNCHRTFARSDMLTRHSRVHSGVKPYSCDICRRYFTRSDHLATHKRTHSGEKPYQCGKCTYTACRRDMITRHMKTHSNGDKAAKSSNVLLLPTGLLIQSESPETAVSSTSSSSEPKPADQPADETVGEEETKRS